MGNRFSKLGRFNNRRTLIAVMSIALVGVLAMTSLSYGDSDPTTFDPTVTFETSTTRATAHPDARITIDNTGNDGDVRSVSVSLPDGFWGSLAAVTEQCENFEPPNPPTTTEWTDDCDADSKIGTVEATATIDETESTLSGDVFLVKSLAPDYAAFVGIRVHAQVGGVDLGYVRVKGIAQLRGNAAGMDTSFDDIPNSITQTVGANERTVDFHVNKMVVDLKSDTDGPNAPLLTNPSKCGTSDVVAQVGDGTSIGGSTNVATVNIPYEVDQCDTVKFAAPDFTFTNTDQTPAQATGFTSQIDFAAESATLSSLHMQLPGFLTANAPAYGAPEDRCPDASFDPNFTPYFDATLCPESALVGGIVLTTPLLSQPVEGNLYLLNKTPLPWIGIDVNPGIGSNPSGVRLSLIGTTDADAKRDPSCVTSCQKAITATFQNIPDAPVTSMSIDLNRPNRQNYLNNTSLSSKVLRFGNAGDSVCQPLDETTANFTSHSAVDDSGPTLRSAGAVSTITVVGCTTPEPADFTSGPVGTSTTDTTPTFGIGALGLAGPFFCAIDNFSAAVNGTSCPAGTDYTKATALAPGAHRVYAGSAANGTGSNTQRGFAVNEVVPAPGPAPSTSFSTTPPAETGTTPSFSFASDQDSFFQCSIDGGAFLPCGDADPAQAGSFTVATADAFLPGSSHNFAVRAQNEEGTVDATPVDATFDVKVAFNPDYSYTSSTYVARAHPELDVTISSGSDEKLKDANISLPDGFLGGLQGAQSICPVATAAAGNCPATSKVGTIETEASIDGSETIARIGGEVYLTDKYQPGDPAGLSIKVEAKIQEVDLGDIIVPVRLAIRGQIEGIDSMVIDIPDSIDPDDNPAGNPFGDDETFFNLRSMVLHLETGAGAAQPLLTNPSSCTTSNFEWEFTGRGSPSSTASDSAPYPVVGCDGLGFAPALSTTLVRSADGKPMTASPQQGVNLTATLNADPGQAGIKAATVTLPKPITVDVVKLPVGLCEQAQYETDTCPGTSLIGSASATSPLLLPGESLSGNVYLLRAVHPRVIPRLFIRLKGRINVSIVATNTFVNQTQIQADFADLPDAPLSSFTMTVNNFLNTRNEPCQEAAQFGNAITGTITGHNGKTSGVNNAVAFDCSGMYVSHTYKKGKNPTLKLEVEGRGLPKFKKFQLKFAKYLTQNKKKLAKKLVVKGDGKKLKASCFKFRSAGVLDLSLCKKQYSKLTFEFKKGALIGAKKLRSPAVTFKATPGGGYRLKLSKNRPQLSLIQKSD